MDKNETYHVVKKLEAQIDKVKSQNDQMEEDINLTLSNQKIGELTQNLQEIVNRRNEKLKADLKKKKN